MNWTELFKNCKQVKEAGFSVPIPDEQTYNDRELREARNELAKFILDNMKGSKK